MPGLARGTHEEHGHRRRGRTAAARRWRMESDAGTVERERERERERGRERERVGHGEKADLRSNRAVIGVRWINLRGKGIFQKRCLILFELPPLTN
jgi:hypothetical protein